MRLTSSASCLCVVLTAFSASAAPVQWTVGSGGNGHWYEYFSDSAGIANWNDVVVDAAGRAHEGQAGYLATVVSAEENTFIHGLTGGGRAWLGGSDAGDEGNWTWRTGPEAGQAVAYINWGPGEPNNSGGEHYLVMNFPHVGGLWNDIPLAAYGPIGYVVEYAAAVPEPQTFGLMLSGLAVLLGWRRQTQR